MKTKGIKKTGLAADIRRIVKGLKRPRAPRALYEALGRPPGQERQKAMSSLHEFFKRGEILQTPTGRIKYNHAWKRAGNAPLKAKILKAIYISSGFSSPDIRRLVDADKSHVEKTIRKLHRDGHLVMVGRRRCAHGAGAEGLYNMSDRTKFRVEVMD
jgi:hypothetical protein